LILFFDGFKPSAYVATPQNLENLSQCAIQPFEEFSALRELVLVLEKPELDWKNKQREWREEFELVPTRTCYENDNCHTCWDLAKGLVRKGEVEWRIQGLDKGPIVRFVSRARRGIGWNRDLCEKWLDW
jgi:hypothetical protein